MPSPHGARPHASGVHFSVPVTRARSCALQLFDGVRPCEAIPMHAVEGAFTTDVTGLGRGARYRYLLDGEEVGDPFARFLPDGLEAFRDEGAQEEIPDPQSEQTMAASRLDWGERTREPHARLLELHRALLHLRRLDPVLSARDRARARLRAWSHGSVLVIDRWVGAEKRRIVANFTYAPASLGDLVDGWHSLLSTSARPPSTLLPPRTSSLLASTRPDPS